jgi:hypothetical protein
MELCSIKLLPAVVLGNKSLLASGYEIAMLFSFRNFKSKAPKDFSAHNGTTCVFFQISYRYFFKVNES